MGKNKKAKWVVRILLLAATAISLYFVPWPIFTAWILPLPETVQEQVDEAIGYGFDGIIVHVDRKGKPPETYAAGYKDTYNKIPANPDAYFKIASVGKLYKAVAIAKLVRKGKLSLDQSLSYYLPELKNRIANADNITLKMMVQHRSGIPNYTDTFNYWFAPERTEDENLAFILDKPANFVPGTDYEYSKTNYLLLGKIMDKVLGFDNFTFIEDQILVPLGLFKTHRSIQDVNIEEVMSGYYVGYNADLKTNRLGSMIATAEDLGKFIRALNDGSVFTDKKERKIYDSLYEFGHTGLIPVYQSIAKYHKDIDAVVIQFTNTVNFEGYNWSLSEVIYNRILGILKKN